MSRVIKAQQCVPASPVFVGRKPPVGQAGPAGAGRTPPAGQTLPAGQALPAGRRPDPGDDPPEAPAAEFPPEGPGRHALPPEGQARAVLEEASEKAKQVIEAARSYGARLTQEAGEQMAREAASVRKRAYEEGYAQGMERGRSDGLEAGRRSGAQEGYRTAVAENRKNLQELGRMIETIEKSKTQILEDFENDLQNLAVAIAKAILKRELETDDKTMRSIILNAMDAYRNQRWVRIYVSGETAAVLMKADGNIVKALQDVSENVKVVPTEGMAEGDCIVETPDQVIDAGVGSQLKKIRVSIEDAMRAQAQ